MSSHRLSVEPAVDSGSSISVLPSSLSVLEAEHHAGEFADSDESGRGPNREKRHSQSIEMLEKAFDTVCLDLDPNHDEGYDHSNASYATSVTSSVKDYKYLLGRRFQAYKAGAYLMPNDDKEIERQELQHEILKLLIGGLHAAPISETEPVSILDLGTGSGSWSIEMGEKYPNAHLLGTDLSPIQPVWVPPNVQFEIDDFEEAWPYQQTFDLINIRFLTGSVQDWPALIRQAHAFTSPGGWIEITEADCRLQTDDGTLDPYSAMARWSELLLQGAEKFGSSMRIATRLAVMVQEAGYHGVKVRKYKMPISPWAKMRRLKEIGAMAMCYMLDGLDAVSLRLFTEQLEWTAEELDQFLKEVAEDVCNLRIHTYYYVYSIVAQKR